MQPTLAAPLFLVGCMSLKSYVYAAWRGMKMLINLNMDLSLSINLRKERGAKKCKRLILICRDLTKRQNACIAGIKAISGNVSNHSMGFEASES